MGTRRIVYVVTLTCAFLFSALYPFWLSWYLFVLVLLLIPFDLIFSIPGMITKRITIIAPFILEKGTDSTLTLTTYQEKGYPAGRIKAYLTISGDDYETRRLIICDPEPGSKFEIKIDTSSSGVIVYDITKIKLTSLIGLFAITISANSHAKVLIMPSPIKPPHIVSLPRGVILRPKAGGGFSEDHELRQYRMGDPVRIIHWKLTAKHDSLIVREPLAPPPHSRLIYIAKWSKAMERELILGRFRWMSEYLLKWELPYCVQFGDNGPVAEISNTADFIKYLYSILDDTAQKMPVPLSLPVRFSWVFRVNAKEENSI